MRSKSMSRRRFLQASGAAAIWVPTNVRGYTASEMRGFYENGTMTVDVSKWELDTPALCVDLDLLEANINKMATTVSANGIASRPHAKTHKCPTISQLQIDSGSVGICTAKVSEAEVMFLPQKLIERCHFESNAQGLYRQPTPRRTLACFPKRR